MSFVCSFVISIVLLNSCSVSSVISCKRKIKFYIVVNDRQSIFDDTQGDPLKT